MVTNAKANAVSPTAGYQAALSPVAGLAIVLQVGRPHQETNMGKLRGEECEDADMRKDAERYRWLRQQIEHGPLLIATVGGWDGLESWSGDTPDSAIDAAMDAER